MLLFYQLGFMSHCGTPTPLGQVRPHPHSFTVPACAQVHSRGSAMFVGLDQKPPNSTALGTHVPGGWRGEPLSVLSTADMCVKVPGPGGEPGTETLGTVLRAKPRSWGLAVPGPGQIALTLGHHPWQQWPPVSVCGVFIEEGWMWSGNPDLGHLPAVQVYRFVETWSQCSSSQHLVRLVASMCLVTPSEGELPSVWGPDY